MHIMGCATVSQLLLLLAPVFTERPGSLQLPGADGDQSEFKTNSSKGMFSILVVYQCFHLDSKAQHASPTHVFL